MILPEPVIDVSLRDRDHVAFFSGSTLQLFFCCGKIKLSRQKLGWWLENEARGGT